MSSVRAADEGSTISLCAAVCKLRVRDYTRGGPQEQLMKVNLITTTRYLTSCPLDFQHHERHRVIDRPCPLRPHSDQPANELSSAA